MVYNTMYLLVSGEKGMVKSAARSPVDMAFNDIFEGMSTKF